MIKKLLEGRARINLHMVMIDVLARVGAVLCIVWDIQHVCYLPRLHCLLLLFSFHLTSHIWFSFILYISILTPSLTTCDPHRQARPLTQSTNSTLNLFLVGCIQRDYFFQFEKLKNSKLRWKKKPKEEDPEQN